ncbi:MAG TPA: hypothetical protein VGY56_20920 [Verrucomicrobiae bacterium]|nr:hypothetical protein [Verrucomicrobiae bacterium]
MLHTTPDILAEGVGQRLSNPCIVNKYFKLMKCIMEKGDGRQGRKYIGQFIGSGAGSIMMQDAPHNPLPDPPHIDLLLAEKRVTHALRVRLAAFALYNGLVFAVFAVLWAVEYKMPNANDSDDIVVPWIWLICFLWRRFARLADPFCDQFGFRFFQRSYFQMSFCSFARASWRPCLIRGFKAFTRHKWRNKLTFRV